MSAKILIVDDEASARLTLENLLFSEGYTLQFAQDGPDGLARARAWQPDVILSDVMMPGMDGFEFCRRIRHDANLGQVPIILITAIADRQARLIGLQAGADDFVTKPIDSVELRTRLRTLTRLDRFRKLNDERLKLEQTHQALLLAHSTLGESETHFRTFIEQSADGVLLVDEQGTIMEWNPALVQMTGLTREQAIGRTIWDIQYQMATPENRAGVTGDQLHNTLRRMLSGQSEFFGRVNDAEIQTVYGERRFIQQTSFPIKTARGYRLGSVVRDITDRKRAEDARRESDERYHLLFQTMVQGVVFQDAEGHIIQANPAAERILGLTMDQLQGRTSIDPQWHGIHEDGSPFPGQEHPAMVALQTGQMVRNVVMGVFNPAANSYRWLNINAVPRFLNGGTRPYQVYTTFEDITERKLAEEALRTSEAHAQAMLKAIPDLMFRLDRSGVFLDYKADVSQLYAQSEPTLIGQRNRDVAPPEFADLIEQEIERVLSTGALRTFEYQLDIPGRGVRDYEARMTPSGPDEVLAVVRDFTERKQIERALRETQFRQEMALKGANAGTWDWNVQTGETVFNDRWAAMIGYTLAELEPISIQTWIALCHPDDLSLSDKLLQQHFAGETDYYECEARLKHKNGSWVWVIDRGRVMEWDAAGQPVRMFGTHLDITEHKREENYTQARLRLANLAYQRLDITTLMRAMLDEAEALTDSQIGFFHFVDDDQNTITLQAWSTNTLKTLCTAEGQGQHYPVAQAGVWADGIRDGQPRIYNDYAVLPDRRNLPDGHAPVIRLISLPIKRNNLIVAALGVGNKPRDYTQHDLDIVQRLAEEAFDIILRKRAEENLRASEEKYRSLLESLDSVVAVIDGEGRFQYVNEVGAQQLGGRPDQFIGRTMADLFPPVVADSQLRSVRQVIASNEPMIRQTESIIQGERRWYRSSIQPIHDEQGRAVLAMLNTTDITPLMTVQTQLEELNRSLEDRVALRTQELAQANESLAAAVDRLQDLDRLKSKFVSDVSHELRTPVTSLSLYVDLLEHGKLEKRDYYVSKLKDQMGRLHKLINDILDLSRLERDQDEGNRSAVDINSIVEHVTATQLVAAEAAGLRLTCEVGDNLPAVVARPDQLTRAITNLVSNAIKYTPAGSVRVRTAERSNRVCVEVIDTGLGIPADEVPHLFDRFYRGQAVAQSSIPGTGLGLSIVKEIIESHDGTVEVTSEPGKGSTFYIWLPVA